MNPEQNPEQTTPVQPTPQTEPAPTCPACKAPLQPGVYFCPNCGHKIKDPPPSTNLSHQIGIYLLSIFLPPFGLVPGVRYILQKDQKTRIIGLVAIVLTFLSLGITIWLSVGVFNTLNQQLNSQMNGLQGF